MNPTYLILIKSDCVRDTQVSNIGAYVSDLFAQTLVATNDEGEVRELEPFDSNNGEFPDVEDDVRDFEGPICLRAYTLQDGQTIEEALRAVAQENQLPLKYLMALPLHPDVKAEELTQLFD